jgi:hypothetical protein
MKRVDKVWNQKGAMVEEERGNPEERWLEARLRTDWSHWVNISAGPAVKSPNIYKTCKIEIFWISEWPNWK